MISAPGATRQLEDTRRLFDASAWLFAQAGRDVMNQDLSTALLDGLAGLATGISGVLSYPLMEFAGPVGGVVTGGARVATHVACEGAAEVAAAQGAAMTLESSAIRFSQSSVNGVEEIVASMRASGWVGAPVDVVATKGGLVTVDNTRVLAASLTNTPVQAVVHGAGEALPASMAGRFGAATTWGEAVAARIGGQNAAYRAANPSGSWFIGATP